MTSPGNDVLYEMIRTIKEEQLPSLHDEMSLGFSNIKQDRERFDNNLAACKKDISGLQMQINTRESQLTLWKWIISITGVSAILQLFYSLRS